MKNFPLLKKDNPYVSAKIKHKGVEKAVRESHSKYLSSRLSYWTYVINRVLGYSEHSNARGSNIPPVNFR